MQVFTACLRKMADRYDTIVPNKKGSLAFSVFSYTQDRYTSAIVYVKKK